jgi:gamma-glutamylcyclotransferase (GGCT)/AIG2-like uncharacterized protein YtfP
MQVNTDKIFVYGTLRKSLKNPNFSFISKHGKFLGEGYVYAKLYDIGEYPGAIPAKKVKLKGEIYEFSAKKRDEILKNLDQYEGIEQNNPQNEYKREETNVRLTSGKQTQAWIYWYQLPVSERKRIKTDDYVLFVEKKNKN